MIDEMLERAEPISDEINNLTNSNSNLVEVKNPTCCSFMVTHPLKISLFIMQIILTIGLVSFSLYEISVLSEEDKDRSVYFSIVSGLVGYWLPSPKSKLK